MGTLSAPPELIGNMCPLWGRRPRGLVNKCDRVISHLLLSSFIFSPVNVFLMLSIFCGLGCGVVSQDAPEGSTTLVLEGGMCYWCKNIGCGKSRMIFGCFSSV